MFRVATWRRSIAQAGSGTRTGSANEKVDATTLDRHDLDPTAMGLDDMAGDGQPEARAAAAPTGLVGLVEALEDPRLVGLRDADPVILDHHRDLLVRRPDPDDDLATVGAELHGIVEEIDHHLPEPILRPADRRNGLRDIGPERDALALGEQAEALDRGGREPAEVDLVEHEERPARLDARQVEQLLDHLDEVIRLDLDLADPVAHPGRDPLAGLVRLANERLGQQADGRQWRPKLMRQVVDELGSDALEPAELGDVLHDQPDPGHR